MQDKQNNDKRTNPGEGQQEGPFTRDAKERNQDFSNEQNPSAENKQPNKTKADKSAGNLSDQYHSATKTGEIQDKNNEANEKAAQQGDDYYDQGAHQPSLAEEEEEQENEKKSKKN